MSTPFVIGAGLKGFTTRVWQAPDPAWKSIEWREGQEAYADGVEGYAAKPYADGTQEMTDWFVGWLDARKQDRAEEPA